MLNMGNKFGAKVFVTFIDFTIVRVNYCICNVTEIGIYVIGKNIGVGIDFELLDSLLLLTTSQIDLEIFIEVIS